MEYVIFAFLGLLVIYSFVKGAAESEEQSYANRAVTGYDSFLFRLKGMQYRSEEEKKMIHSMKVGDNCVLLCESWNVYDENAIAVWYKGVMVGYVDRETASKYHSVVVCSYPVACFIKHFQDDEDLAKVVVNVEVFYESNAGTSVYQLENTLVCYNIIEPDENLVKNGVDFKEMLLNDHYLFFDRLKEFANRHLEWYGVERMPDDDRELIEQIESDDNGFIEFVSGLHRGFFRSKSDISSLLRQSTKERVVGDSKILKKRIYAYLDYKGILLV